MFDEARRRRLQKECNDALVRLAAGETDALTVIYHRMGRLILSVALQITENPADAQDVLQDVLLRINDAAKSYAPGSNATAWVLTVARNQSLNKIRERGRTLPLETFEDVTDPADEIERAGERMSLADALKTLPEIDRTILNLRYGPGLPCREIAQVVELSPAAVEKRCQRAISRLREILCWDGEGKEKSPARPKRVRDGSDPESAGSAKG